MKAIYYGKRKGLYKLTISVDEALVKEAKAKHINLSATFNQMLKDIFKNG